MLRAGRLGFRAESAAVLVVKVASQIAQLLTTLRIRLPVGLIAQLVSLRFEQVRIGWAADLVHATSIPHFHSNGNPSKQKRPHPVRDRGASHRTSTGWRGQLGVQIQNVVSSYPWAAQTALASRLNLGPCGRLSRRPSVLR